MFHFTIPQLKGLRELLTPVAKEDSDSENEDQHPGFKAKFVNPYSPYKPEDADIDQQPESSAASGSKSFRKSTKPETLDEWEQREEYFNSDENEVRKTPEYRIIYKQAVSPEDLYLQIGLKTSSTASCEEMCLEIQLPNETVGIEHMELEVTPNEIDLKTPVYRLKLPLVQTIDPDYGKARWDGEQKILRLNLVMKREYDCVNF